MNFECVNKAEVGEDGWLQLAPFGDHPGRARILDDAGRVTKEVDAIQRLDAEAANEMVRDFNSPLRRVGRWFRGLPIFNGHPDAPGIGGLFPDKEEKGQIVDLAVRPEGLYGRPTFNGQGADLLNSQKGLAPSVRWSSRHFSDDAGKPVLRPTRLISVGLTRTPNLPVEALNSQATELAATDTQPNPDSDMKPEALIAALKKHGIELANTADEAAVLGAIDQLGQASADRQALATEVANVKSAADSANTAAVAAKTEVTNERTGRIGDLLDFAQLSGRITEAERATWTPRLTADFANERNNLLKEPVKLRTTSQVSAEDRKSGARQRTAAEQLTEIANSKYEASPKRQADPSGAWMESFIQAKTENPELVRLMEAPVKA